MTTKLTRQTIEILIDGQPNCLIDVPAFEGDDPAKAERRALFTVMAQGYEPEQITARYAPQYAETCPTCGTPNVISERQHELGQQCDVCTQRDSGF